MNLKNELDTLTEENINCKHHYIPMEIDHGIKKIILKCFICKKSLPIDLYDYIPDFLMK